MHLHSDFAVKASLRFAFQRALEAIAYDGLDVVFIDSVDVVVRFRVETGPGLVDFVYLDTGNSVEFIDDAFLELGLRGGKEFA